MPWPKGRPRKPIAGMRDRDGYTVTATGPDKWTDLDDEWTEQIKAAHPVNTKSHAEYEQALQMVGNRHSKGALVALVCWLLQKREYPVLSGVYMQTPKFQISLDVLSTDMSPEGLRVLVGEPMRSVTSVPAGFMDDLSQPIEVQFHQDAAPIAVPSDWRKGQLLNVRNTGDGYTVTLWPEEFDVRYPQRALKFTNPAQCQDFISRWYAREAHDPRAV